MISKVLCFAAFLSAFNFSPLEAQVTSAPFVERFDTVVVPKLPLGWATTTTKNSSGDFSTTTSTSSSAPNTLISTDSKIPQSLISPTISFAGKVAGALEFYERRTSTHNSGLLVEAILMNDTSHIIQIGDTLKNGGSTNYLLRSLNLPSSLNNQPAVRFRWRAVGNGSGATGTLRIDDVVITVQKTIDLSIGGMQFFPIAVRSGENLSVRVSVVNRAIAGLRWFLLQLFDDKNFDSFTAPEEKIDEQEVQQSFAFAESTTFTLDYPAINAGNHRLVARLVLLGDEDTSNDTASSTIFVGYPSRSMIINEIMYAPAAGPEWVECINNFSDTIFLSQWKIGDNTTSRSVITLQSIRISPGQLFILAKDSSIMYYFPTISVPVIKTSFATLNNDADAVVIADPTGFAADSVAYRSTWGGINGRSLERIDPASASNQAGNWGSSRYAPYATPGTINSLSKKERDISIEDIFLSTMSPTVNQEFGIGVVVKNIGREPIVQSTARFFLSTNNDSIPQSGELIAEITLPTIPPSDSQTIIRPISISSQGLQRAFISVETPRDDDSLNNSRELSFVVGVQQHSIIINEIMYAPVGDMPEWVEFYNASTSAVNVGGWKISDANTKSQSMLAGTQSIIQPGTYFLAATDSSLQNYFTVPVPVFVTPFSSLNNTTPDAVVLLDDRGVVMDSVRYTPAWGGANGKSLERIDYEFSSTDSANWKSSSPTPGIENDVARKDFDLTITSGSAKVWESSLTVAVTVRNSGRRAVAGFIVRFYYDVTGDSTVSPVKLLHTANGEYLGPSDSVLVQFNWQTTAKGKIPIICEVDFPGDQRISNNTIFFSGVKKFSPQSVVINEILYEPLAGYSEFIELINRSADTIDVQGWKITDATSRSGNRFQLPNESLLLFPNHFLLIAGDSAIYAQYPLLRASTGGLTLVTNRDLSLNNSGDDVVLADQTNTSIDSVRYSPSWHNQSLNTSTIGMSVERINPSLGSNDKRNWSTSVALTGATPLQTNSIFTKSIPTAAGISLSPNPFSPDYDGFEDILAITYSLPSTVSMIRVRCFDVQGRLVRTLANNEPVASSGTLLWNGLDDDNRRVRIGMYIILFEVLDAAGGVLRVMKDVVVVATKL